MLPFVYTASHIILISLILQFISQLPIPHPHPAIISISFVIPSATQFTSSPPSPAS